MKKISETATEETYVDYFQGQQMRMHRNKLTGELTINADDVAKGLGYKDQADMMADPEVQAKAIEYQKSKGEPLFIEKESTNHIN